MNEFVLFQSFIDEAEAMPVIEIFKESGIEYEVEQFKEPLDSILAGDVIRDKFYLKIMSQDFHRANEVLNQAILKNIPNIEKDYYLFSFSNQELQEIINKPDEWSRQDLLVAKDLLNKRGISISDEKINTIKNTRTKELGMPEKGNSAWIIFGYILALLGGVMSMIIGLPYLVAKKTLPDGSRVYVYDQGTRNHGKAISILWIGMTVIHFIIGSGLRYAFIGFLGSRF
jgi:hypothetical protein